MLYVNAHSDQNGVKDTCMLNGNMDNSINGCSDLITKKQIHYWIALEKINGQTDKQAISAYLKSISGC